MLDPLLIDDHRPGDVELLEPRHDLSHVRLKRGVGFLSATVTSRSARIDWNRTFLSMVVLTSSPPERTPPRRGRADGSYMQPSELS